MAPPRCLEHVTQLVTPALSPPHVAPHRRVLPEGYFQYFVGFNVFGEAVLDWLLWNLLREGSK